MSPLAEGDVLKRGSRAWSAAALVALLPGWVLLHGTPPPVAGEALSGRGLPDTEPFFENKPSEDPAARTSLQEGQGGATVPAPQLEEVAEVCRRIARKLASVSLEECLESGLLPSGSRSVEGSPLLLREYPPLPERPTLGRVLLIGGIHGDEYSSVSVTFKWLGILNRFHSGLFHWRVVPLLNPDGLLRAESQRMNSRGVDLNRNFPCPDWHAATKEEWEVRTARNPRRFPGADPLSEPESRWLAEEIESFRPDVIISVHAPHNVLDFDGPPEPPQRLGPLHLKLLGTYPGSLGRFAGVQSGLPVVTLELPSAGTMPSSQEQRDIWIDLVRWLRERMEEEAAGRQAR